MAYEVITRERILHPDVQPLLIVLTDGAGNVPLGKKPVKEENKELAALFSKKNIHSVVINMEKKPLTRGWLRSWRTRWARLAIPWKISAAKRYLILYKRKCRLHRLSTERNSALAGYFNCFDGHFRKKLVDSPRDPTLQRGWRQGAAFTGASQAHFHQVPLD
jgi:hypothetical protein